MQKFFIIILFIPILFSKYVSAGFDNPLPRNDSDEPWHISADKAEYDHKSRVYIGKGNVTISKNDKKLLADYVRFDYNTMNVFAKGNVIMTAGQDIMAGTTMEIDLNTQTGTIYNGKVFVKENHFHIKGDKIQKTGKNAYTAHNAMISTCDGDTPAWKITGKNVRVTIDGYGFVNHAALWAKKIPVLYTPFLVFPVKRKRQTGFLPPRFGYSDEDGAEINIPFYWAINQSSDATFYEHYLEKRGSKIGLEYRYVLDEQSKGTLMYDFISDSKSSELPVTDPHRYWFRMKHDQSMPLDFFAKIDIDIVSDQSYLENFRDGYTGFDKTKEYFNKDFDRGIDDYSDNIRVSSAMLGNASSDWSLYTGVRWYDNVINRRTKDADTTLHKLPFIQLNTLKQPVAEALHITPLPLYWKLDSEYTYFHRDKGTKGHRVDLYPRIYLSEQFRKYLNIESSLGLRETLWRIDEYEDLETGAELLGNDNTRHREMYDIEIDMSADIFRIYRSGTYQGARQIRHMARPQIVYKYIPDQDQDKYPLFDSLDRIEEKNRITYSVTNLFTTKSGTDTGPGHQFCRLKLEQSYDFSKTGQGGTSPGEIRRFSPISGEIEITPGRLVSLQADAEWSTYDSRFQSHDISANIWDHRGDKLFVEYRYTLDRTESVYTDAVIRLSEKISIYTDYERSLLEGKNIRTCTGFLYNTQCWSADFYYTDEDDDYKYAFMINLYGLGGIGKKNERTR